MKMKLITPPTMEPITLTDAKNYLRVDHNTEDGLITQMISSAREFCEAYQNRVHGEQTWELYPLKVETFYELMFPVPIMSIDEVTYLLADGTTQTLTAVTDYRTDTRSMTAPAELFIVNKPTEELDKYTPLTITVTAGSDNVPARVIQAMHLLIGTFYENRESYNGHIKSGQIEINNRKAVEALLDPDRIMSF